MKKNYEYSPTLSLKMFPIVALGSDMSSCRSSGSDQGKTNMRPMLEISNCGSAEATKWKVIYQEKIINKQIKCIITRLWSNYLAVSFLFQLS